MTQFFDFYLKEFGKIIDYLNKGIVFTLEDLFCNKLKIEDYSSVELKMMKMILGEEPNAPQFLSAPSDG